MSVQKFKYGCRPKACLYASLKAMIVLKAMIFGSNTVKISLNLTVCSWIWWLMFHMNLDYNMSYDICDEFVFDQFLSVTFEELNLKRRKKIHFVELFSKHNTLLVDYIKCCLSLLNMFVECGGQLLLWILVVGVSTLLRRTQWWRSGRRPSRCTSRCSSTPKRQSRPTGQRRATAAMRRWELCLTHVQGREYESQPSQTSDL